MISINVNKKFLSMPQNAKVSLEFNNHVFDDAIMSGEYTLPFEIPYTGNGNKLDFIYELLKRERITSYRDAALYYKNLKLWPGIFDILQVGENISASFRLNISSLPSLNKSLRDFDLGIIDYDSDLLELAKDDLFTDITGPTPINWPPMYMPDFYGDKNPDFRGWINNWDPNAEEFISNSVTGDNANAMVPMVYLVHILEKCFLADGYKLLQEGWVIDPVIRRAMLFNNLALDKMSYSSVNGVRATMTVEHEVDQSGPVTLVFDDDSTGSNHDSSGDYDQTTGEYVIWFAGDHHIRVKVPFEFESDFPYYTTDLVTVRIRVDGVPVKTVTRDFHNEPDGEIDFTYNFVATGGDLSKIITVTVEYSHSVDSDLKIITNDAILQINDFNVTTGLNVMHGEIVLNRHVPDVTFGELLNALRSNQNLLFDFDHDRKTVGIYDFDLLFDSQPKSYTNKVVPGHLIKRSNHAFRSFDYQLDSNDGFSADNFKEYSVEQFLGSFITLNYANSTGAPPAVNLVGKYIHVQDSNCIYKCTDMGGSVYKWQYFTHAPFKREVDKNGYVDVSPALSPLLMVNIDKDDYPSSFPAPQVKMQGSSNEFDLGHNDYGLRIFYFFHPQDTTVVFPLPTTTCINYNGTLLGGRGLVYNSDEGIYNYWKKHIALRARNEVVEHKIKHTIADLANFKVTDQLEIRFAWFLIKQMRVEIGEEVEEATYITLQI